MSAKPRPRLTAGPEYWRAIDICRVEFGDTDNHEAAAS